MENTMIGQYINNAPAPSIDDDYTPEEVKVVELIGTEKQVAYARDLIKRLFCNVELAAYNIYLRRAATREVYHHPQTGEVGCKEHYTEADVMKLREMLTARLVSAEELHSAGKLIDLLAELSTRKVAEWAKNIHDGRLPK